MSIGSRVRLMEKRMGPGTPALVFIKTNVVSPDGSRRFHSATAIDHRGNRFFSSHDGETFDAFHERASEEFLAVKAGEGR